MRVPPWLYLGIGLLGMAFGAASYFFGFAVAQRCREEAAALNSTDEWEELGAVPVDSVDIVYSDGKRASLPKAEADIARATGARLAHEVDPRHVELEAKRRQADDLGVTLGITAAVFGYLLAGFVAYRLLRMILDRFVGPKWSCLVSGLACGASIVLATGLVLGLLELSKLPTVSATRNAKPP